MPLKWQYTPIKVLLRWLNSVLDPLPHTFPVTVLGRLSHFCNFPKPSINIHTHVTQLLVRFVKVREEAWFKLLSPVPFFYSWHKYFWHLLWEQPNATLLMPSKRSCLKVCTFFSPHLCGEVSVALSNSYTFASQSGKTTHRTNQFFPSVTPI